MKDIRAKLSEEFNRQKENRGLALSEGDLVRATMAGEELVIPKDILIKKLKQTPELKDKINSSVYEFGADDTNLPISWSWFDRYLIRKKHEQ